MEGRFIEQRPPELVILAEDKLQDLRMVRRSRSFEDLTLADVIETICADHGLQAQIDIDSPHYNTLAQLNQSDLAFLRERARLIDAEVWVEGTDLYVQSRARRKVSSLELTYKQRLHEFSVLADIAHQRSSLTVSGWDISAKEKLEYAATDDCIQTELGSGIGGSRVLTDAFGERLENVAHMTPMSDEETRTLAESCFRTMARQFVTGRGLAEGDARLKAGAHVTINGVGSLFNGLYFVNSVQHMFCQETGFKTQFCVERPFIGAVA
jgi:phage protein D